MARKKDFLIQVRMWSDLTCMDSPYVFATGPEDRPVEMLITCRIRGSVPGGLLTQDKMKWGEWEREEE